ncbi:hypothetical protein [Rhodopirellula sp. P2]|uniref:hypothetical protein n=1 Tax=Rhodopirellula sp. P2 TaxID=2127060 RepID=UPI0023674EE4|nr:hypothetical protein [Rhodopirellula sp. P2]WDQ19525.1 hypothetical protein PSR62_23240 [Rhodopirellula sp. P2]
MLAVLAIAMVILFATRMTPKVIQPGNLTTAHSQILSGELAQDRCAACHQNATSNGWLAAADDSSGSDSAEGNGFFSLASWIGGGGQHADMPTVPMTDLCLNCHEQQMPRQSARWAHNLSPEIRDELTLAAIEKRDGKAFDLAASLSDANPSANSVKASENSLAIQTVSRTSAFQNNLACSICHQEHHGADADLAAITDSRCQTCHVNQFGSFADSHPEFGQWPYQPTSNIHFDHGRHANIHFPSEAEKNSSDPSTGNRFATFDCKTCHIGPSFSSFDLDSTDPVMTTLPYEIACAPCHDSSLRVQIAEGPSLLQLPTLPEDIAAQVNQWPELATGFADGRVDGWMALMLRTETSESALHRFQRVEAANWDSPIVQVEAVSLAKAIRKLSQELATSGQDALMQRLMDAGVDERTAQPLVESFPPQLIRDAMGVWFGGVQPITATASEAAPVADSGFGLLDDELGKGTADLDPLLDVDPLLSNDPLLADDPLAAWGTADESDTVPAKMDWAAELAARYDAAKTQSFGGWYRDDLTMSIRYRGKGHSDAVMRSMIEIIQRLPGDDPLRETMLAQPAVQACVACHQVNSNPGSEPALASMRWRAFQAKSDGDRLTHFSHTPHLNIQGLQDCQHCHQLGTTNPANAVHMEGESPVELSPEFLPMTKANCASCHTKSAAGDHCTRCHRYHVHDVP